MTERGLGVRSGELAQHFEDPFWCSRVIHYPGLEQQSQGTDSSLGCGEHCDYGFLTLLLADDLFHGRPGALQVRDEHNEWATIEAESGALVCNIGDMLSRWTGGLYRSTPHRVLRPRQGRVSIAYFHEPSYTAVVRPLPGFSCAGGQEGSSQGVMYGDHLLSKTSTNFREVG